MTISNELLDSLLADYQTPEDLIGEGGLLKQLTQRLVERALQAEMTEHLGYAKHKSMANPAGNTRNGTSKKTLKGELGALQIEVPRDRNGSFEPRLIPKHQTRWTGFDDKILSLYASGDSVQSSKRVGTRWCCIKNIHSQSLRGVSSVKCGTASCINRLMSSLSLGRWFTLRAKDGANCQSLFAWPRNHTTSRCAESSRSDVNRSLTELIS